MASPSKNGGPNGATARALEKVSSPENGTIPAGGNGSGKPAADQTAPPPVSPNGNASSAGSGFNQLRNEFLTAARRVATNQKCAIGEVVEWASGGAFKYTDIGRMTDADAAKLRAASEVIGSALGGPAS